MRVYFLSFIIDDNSVADYFISLSNEIAKHHRVVIITSKIRHTNIEIDDSIEILKWPSKRPSKFKDFLFLCKQVQRYKPHAMISIFTSVNMFLLVGRLYSITHRIAWIRTLSTQFPQKRFNQWRRIVNYRFATLIIVNSEATKSDAIDFFKIGSNKIKVLPNSVVDFRDSVDPIPFDPTKLLYVGRLHPSKGVDIIIHALKILKGKGIDVHLDVIGTGSFKSQLDQLITTLELKNSITFFERQPKSEVLKAYRSAYLTIIPSYSEAFGFTVIEAMSLACCVVGANNTGIKEIIIPNKTGLLFETGNAQDLADKIETLLNSTTLRNELAEQGYRRFRDHYENKVCVNRDLLFLRSNHIL